MVALTGATGFIGGHLVPVLAAAGWTPRILVRRDPANLGWGNLSIQVVAGELSDAAALCRLVEGAQVVIHLAGLIKAARAADYMSANREGTRAVCAAMLDVSPQIPLLLISSLAAREPRLSTYAASKRAAEYVARELLADRLTILRPPAVYGPGDRETLTFFKLAALPWVPLPGDAQARNAVIHVDDLCTVIERLLRQPFAGGQYAIADQCPEGYSWRDIMSAAVSAIGARPRGYHQMPAFALRGLARLGDVGRLSGRADMLNSEKLRELLHSDWAVRPAELPVLDGWRPRYGLQQGFHDAVLGYRRLGWLQSR